MTVNEFLSTAQKSKEWIRIDFRQRMDELEKKRALYRTKLDELLAAGSASRNDLRIGLERSLSEFMDAFARIKR